MESEISSQRKCNCSGIRYCKMCQNPEYRKLFKDLHDIQTDEIKLNAFIKCEKCSDGLISKLKDETIDCNNHEYKCADFDFNGLHCVKFLSDADEEDLVKHVRQEVFVES